MKQTQRTLTILTMATAVSLGLWKCTSTPKAPDVPLSWAESQFVQDRITTRMLEASPGPLCPRYGSVQKLKAWDAIMKAIVAAESNFKPNSTYHEKTQGIDKVTGKPVLSEGYLQLSYQDTLHQYYRELPAVKEISYAKKNLQDPHVNLSAGIAIMDDRIRRSGPDVVKALAPYWSTVREYPVKLLPNLKKYIPECFQ